MNEPHAPVPALLDEEIREALAGDRSSAVWKLDLDTLNAGRDRGRAEHFDLDRLETRRDGHEVARAHAIQEPASIEPTRVSDESEVWSQERLERPRIMAADGFEDHSTQAEELTSLGFDELLFYRSPW